MTQMSNTKKTKHRKASNNVNNWHTTNEMANANKMNTVNNIDAIHTRTTTNHMTYNTSI